MIQNQSRNLRRGIRERMGEIANHKSKIQEVATSPTNSLRSKNKMAAVQSPKPRNPKSKI
jgi:hypothetical protein